ncbi:hypothetical protein EW026_g2619 [Hermanssonia centrifuga]|uniref:Uncharacterized protein n=1 Tax=Hermanssonia centrifuga TaxID=98765 RepID=A0A4S4KNQ6_9APHY|nr:hypothetical protein EW026_g2619 [Hermanssonia centrifuga]
MASRCVAVTFADKPRMSCTKYLERRIIRAWKSVSRMTRKPQRASLLPEDFILLTAAARRRSIMFGSPAQH